MEHDDRFLSAAIDMKVDRPSVLIRQRELRQTFSDRRSGRKVCAWLAPRRAVQRHGAVEAKLSIVFMVKIDGRSFVGFPYSPSLTPYARKPKHQPTKAGINWTIAPMAIPECRCFL
jgi:hypothetical protein